MPGRVRESNPLVAGPDVPLVGDSYSQLIPTTLDGDGSMEELMLTYLESSKIPANDDTHGQETDLNSTPDVNDASSPIAARGSLEVDYATIAELVSGSSTTHTGGSLGLDLTGEDNIDGLSSSANVAEGIEEVDFTTRYVPRRSRNSSFRTYPATEPEPVDDSSSQTPLHEESTLQYLASASSPFPDYVSSDADDNSMDTADDMSLLTMVTSGSLEVDAAVVHIDEPSLEVNHTIIETIDEMLSSMLVAGISPKVNQDMVHISTIRYHLTQMTATMCPESF